MSEDVISNPLGASRESTSVATAEAALETMTEKLGRMTAEIPLAARVGLNESLDALSRILRSFRQDQAAKQTAERYLTVYGIFPAAVQTLLADTEDWDRWLESNRWRNVLEAVDQQTVSMCRAFESVEPQIPEPFSETSLLHEDLFGKFRARANQRLQHSSQQLAASRRRESDESLAATFKAAKDVQRLAEVARTDAGKIGSTRLSSFFGSLASKERRASNVMRWAALASAFVAVVWIISIRFNVAQLFTGDLLNLDILAPDANRLILGALGSAAFGAIAAYLARLAGQHRTQANWARSIEVQLDSFELFMGPIKDSASINEIHVEFARRVLGAPPERGNSRSDATTLSAADVLALLRQATESRTS